jgi:hypothetical protein
MLRRRRYPPYKSIQQARKHLEEPESVEASIARLLKPNQRNFLGIIGIQGDGKSTLANEITHLHPEIFPEECHFAPDNFYELLAFYNLLREDPLARKIECSRAILTYAQEQDNFLLEILPHLRLDEYIDFFIDNKLFDNIGIIYVIGDDNLQRISKRERNEIKRSRKNYVREMRGLANERFPELFTSEKIDYILVIDNSGKPEERRVLLEFQKGELKRSAPSLPKWIKKRLSPPVHSRIVDRLWGVFHRTRVNEYPNPEEVIQKLEEQQQK